ncbi:reverse transcriptase domain-containing protein [Tanacetum coccineum]
MMAIFHDMIEETMEVFMDDFLVFGDSFSSCLSHLDKMLKRCEDTNLVLNWEKCHFMVKEGIVLGHKISKSGIEVDKAKVDVIAKLPHPTTEKQEEKNIAEKATDHRTHAPEFLDSFKLTYKKSTIPFNNTPHSPDFSDFPPQPQHETSQPPEESIKEFFVKHAQEMITMVQSTVKLVTQQLEQYKGYLENSSNAITPDLPTKELDNSLSMGDEHLSTISEMKSDKVIKSSVKELVLIPRESKGISDDTCDVPFCDNSPPLDVLNDHFKIFSDFNDDCTSSDDGYGEDIDCVEASPPYSELVSLKEVKDDIIREKLLNINLLIAKIESLNDNSTPDCVFKSPIPVKDSDTFFEKSDTSLSYSDNSLPEFETFSNHTEETSSGSTTTHADNSLPEYDSFLFEIEPDQGELTRIVIEDNLGEPRVHVPNELPTHPTLMLDSDFIPSDDSLGSDLEVSFPSGSRNKIFDPRIFFEVQSKRFLSRDTFSIPFIRNPLC